VTAGLPRRGSMVRVVGCQSVVGMLSRAGASPVRRLEASTGGRSVPGRRPDAPAAGIPPMLIDPWPQPHRSMPPHRCGEGMSCTRSPVPDAAEPSGRARSPRRPIACRSLAADVTTIAASITSMAPSGPAHPVGNVVIRSVEEWTERACLVQLPLGAPAAGPPGRTGPIAHRRSPLPWRSRGWAAPPVLPLRFRPAMRRRV
jgi:hypothetical protein